MNVSVSRIENRSLTGLLGSCLSEETPRVAFEQGLLHTLAQSGLLHLQNPYNRQEEWFRDVNIPRQSRGIFTQRSTGQHRAPFRRRRTLTTLRVTRSAAM